MSRAPVRFGTDGIRGPAGQPPITEEVGRAVGHAAVRLARALGGRRVVVGRDPRPSGAGLATAVGQGVVSAGGIWVDAGIVPTGAVCMAVHQGLADAGVIVTASHNPASDNGFKVVGARGRKLDEAGCAAVEAWLAEPTGRSGDGARRDGAAKVADVWRREVQRVVPRPNPLAGRRLAVDLAAGAGRIAAPWLAEAIGAELVLLGTEGAINDGCGSEHLGPLSDAVVAQGCDGGLAIDGDGDRCRLVDGDGRPIAGDAVIWLLARAMAATGVAVTVMSNGALEPALPGVRVVRTPVGDRFVRDAMDREELPLGGEESGHLLFGDVAAGDGLIAGIRALAAAFDEADTVAAAFAEFRPFPREVVAVRVADRRPLHDVPELQAARDAGLTRLGPHGRVFLRYSGTEPVLRILVEGQPAPVVGEVATMVADVARQVLG